MSNCQKSHVITYVMAFFRLPSFDFLRKLTETDFISEGINSKISRKGNRYASIKDTIDM